MHIYIKIWKTYFVNTRIYVLLHPKKFKIENHKTQTTAIDSESITNTTATLSTGIVRQLRYQRQTTNDGFIIIINFAHPSRL